MNQETKWFNEPSREELKGRILKLQALFWAAAVSAACGWAFFAWAVNFK